MADAEHSAETRGKRLSFDRYVLDLDRGLSAARRHRDCAEAEDFLRITAPGGESGAARDQAREFFANGLTQDVISALGRFSSLTVMSWNAVLPFKDKPAGATEIARSLGVRYQVAGSVLQAACCRQATVCGSQLSWSDGRVLWSGHGAGTPMEVSSTGTTDLDALVMFVVDATKPFSAPAELE
jgi:hypothetical protein